MKTPEDWFNEMKAMPCLTENDLKIIIGRI